MNTAFTSLYTEAITLTTLCIATIVTLHILFNHTLWGCRFHGKRDAKKSAVRPYDHGWTSPYVNQVAESYYHKAATLTHKAERRQTSSYKKVSDHIADIEKLEARIRLLKDHYAEASEYQEDGIKEVQLRRLRSLNIQLDHIGTQQTELTKGMAKVRASIVTNRNRYLQKLDSIYKKRDEKIHAYWTGACRHWDDCPIDPEFDHNKSEAHRLYVERCSHVLASIDHYVDIYIQPTVHEDLNI